MSENSPEQRVITSPPNPAGPPGHAIALQPSAASASVERNVAGDQPREWLVTAAHAHSGRAYPPFLVRALGEAAARSLCQRKYLVVQSVELYVEEEGRQKPRTLTYGPSISDKDFERDYGRRPADQPGGEGRVMLRILEILCFGLLGVMTGVFIWRSGDDPPRRD
jgi:hypothetical protein